MNTNDSHDRDAPLDASLRLQLRGLRRDIDPAGDLWPGIAARLAAAPQAARQPAAPRRGHGASRFAPWALAASLVLVVGVAWKMQPPSLAPAASTAGQDETGLMLNRQADAMTREYQAALHELEAAAPGRTEAHPEQPVLRELDHSARQIRTALERDPDARFLLDRLRKTYTLRLELTQRADMT
ncbi:MAG TPA: hypothetical protein VFT52_00800 [Luteimonas sp.]|jgi:hypothetical protein|nr:hypothetical protein [Luteimonas sp.]